MVAESQERTFVFKLHGYSRLKELFKNGECVASPPFSVGGHNFVLSYFPNGYSAGHAGFVSFALVLDSAEAKDVKVDVRLSAIGNVGMVGLQVLPCGLSTGPQHVFIRNCLSGGFDFYHASLEGSRGIIVDDCLTIRCDVTVEKNMHSDEIRADQFVVVPPSDLHMHFGSLLESMVGADVTFHVGRKKFLAHRFVLAARSSVFKVELYGAMKENAGNPIEILDMEADVFKCLLHFIYTDTLLEMASRDVVMAGHLLVAADRYDIERLKLICEHKLCSYIDANMVANSLVLADQHGCNGLKEACLQFLACPSNLEAMMASDGYEHLKTSCPSVLRELVASLLAVELKAAKNIVMTL